MGAATIISHAGDGLYIITKSVEGLDGALTWLANRRTQLEAELPILRANEAQAITAVSNAVATTDLLIADWVSGLGTPPESLALDWSAAAMAYVKSATERFKLPEAIINAVSDVAKKGQQAARLTEQRAALQAEYLSVIDREAEMLRIQAEYETPIEAWCADLTTTLAVGAEVATLEPPGEIDPKIGGGLNIAPGYTDNTWNIAYGKIQHALGMTSAGFVWNMVMTTPWMKWQPLWRYATVLAVNAETLNVELQPVVSKVGVYLSKDTTVNEPWESSMSGVAVNYMSCGAAVFEVGDEVIVQFNRISVGAGLESYEPVVIGFKDHPRICRGFLLFTPDPVLIRAGAIRGASASIVAGITDWQGDWGALSFNGPKSRYGGWTGSDTISSAIYSGGKLKLYALRDDGFFILVTGVALAEYEDEIYINLMGYIKQSDTLTAIAYQARLLDDPVIFSEVGRQVLYSGPYLDDSFLIARRPWHFSSDGKLAVSLTMTREQAVLPLNTRKFRVSFLLGSANFADLGIAGPYIGEEKTYYIGVDYAGLNEIDAVYSETLAIGLGDRTFDLLINGTSIISGNKSFRSDGGYFGVAYENRTYTDTNFDIISFDLRKSFFTFHEYEKTAWANFLIVALGDDPNTHSVDYSKYEAAQHKTTILHNGIKTTRTDTGLISTSESGNFTRGFLEPNPSTEPTEFSISTNSSMSVLNETQEGMVFYEANFSVGDSTFLAFYNSYLSALAAAIEVMWYSEGEAPIPTDGKIRVI